MSVTNARQRPADWFRVENVDDLSSPALLIYRERVAENISRMSSMAGGPTRLRPHVKTHKLAEVVRMQQEAGIQKFKCATIAEAEMLGRCQVKEVLLAYQPVGPNVRRLKALIQQYPATRFSAVIDDPGALQAIEAEEFPLELLLDLDCGMHRTGISPGPQALSLYRAIASSGQVRPGGLHVYDGHIHQSDPVERQTAFVQAFAPILKFREQILAAGLPVPRVVAGGTPTFPFCAQDPSLECSPGTCLLWDAGYGTKMPDLDFLPAAVLLTRVVSKPSPERLCLDLGHKAVASENPHPRVQFLNLPDAKPVMHSEEHLVVESNSASGIPVGSACYGLPWHVCPTVALHGEVWMVEKGWAVERWKVEARQRSIGI